VLLLDEPLGALDLKLREEMQVELKGIQHDVGITFVFVTHDQGEALSMSNRVAVFNNGRIEQVGAPREIYEHPSTSFVAGFVGTSNMLTADEARRLMDVDGAVSIRPERISIASSTRAAPVGDVHVSGTVTDVQYLGADSRVRVRLDGTAADRQLVVGVSSAGLGDLHTGDTVQLAWPRDAVLTIDNPGGNQP